MSNFGFLKNTAEYEMFALAAVEAEKVYASSPAMCVVGCRKAMELAVKWVYSADNTMEMPYKDNLQSMIHEPCFRFTLDRKTWGKLLFIVKVGNLAVHTGQYISQNDALTALKGLFEFVEWIDYCYGSDYQERHFDEAAIPTEKVVLDTKRIKEQESLLGEKNAEIDALRKKLEEISEELTKSKEEHQRTRTFEADDLTEFRTRKVYIDVDLKELGWKFTGFDADVLEEYEVDGMAGIPGQKGYADYVLMGKDGLPLAVIEAKKSTKDPNVGRQQCSLYADCLERKFGRRPMMFTTNGFETYFWDDQSGPQRQVSSLFSKGDLQKLMNRRSEQKDLDKIPISDTITGRYYQKEAIRAVCDNLKQGFRKHLLVMATGTGKTRTAASLTDVLSRGGYVTNVLFLADRTALVKQAKDAFKDLLPDMSLCNLCSNKDDRAARIVFSTYPTMLNAIDMLKSADGRRMFTPAHFDLIITDESHRSIFNKYRAIFDYFDAIMVGLTATPKSDVDHNTYEFFEMETGVPTYAYDYETAVYNDHVLVPYYNYEVKTKFISEGIKYDDLSPEDKKRYEEDFVVEDDYIPSFIPSAALNKFVFNEKTVDIVLQDLMERGIKVAGGDRLGKTIIFAQNKRHAEFILERFNKLYPYYKGTFAKRVICDDSYAQTIIDEFKVPEKEPHIVVSVDMMDTGIDVPECVNLVFFKVVRSKSKFWQMIGRGTRLCPGLSCVDQIDGEYTGKRRFMIFDYCGNFEFFRESKNEANTKDVKSLAENIFTKKIRIAAQLQNSEFAGEEYQTFRNELVGECRQQVNALNDNLISVKLKKEYVEKYRKPESYVFLGDSDVGELTEKIAGLVYLNDSDEAAKRFDNFMYGLMLSRIGKKGSFEKAMRDLIVVCQLLEKKISIPQIKEKIELIQKIQTDEFWADSGILDYENARKELRGLIQFLTGGEPGKNIYTRLTDPVIEEQEGKTLPASYDFEDYKLKVNRYIIEHGTTIAIYKLKHNMKISTGDYMELGRIFTQELGSKEEYKREYGDTPFGLLIRRIAKLDHDAAMQAFSEFINDESLNQKQIAFVHKVINYVEQNGYMDDATELMKPPFDKPTSFLKLFDPAKKSRLIRLIQDVKDNAIAVG